MEDEPFSNIYTKFRACCIYFKEINSNNEPIYRYSLELIWCHILFDIPSQIIISES
jgi:hypothetical protein